MRDDARRSGRGARRREALALAVLAAVLCAAQAAASPRWLFEGLAEGELWNTDSGSRLLSKNEGDPALAGSLRLWAGFQAHPRVQLVALGHFAGGDAYEHDGVEAELEQAFVRYTIDRQGRFTLEGGRLYSTMGNFSRRYLSDINPLIGAPDSYGLGYPLGLRLTGAAGRFDFGAALVDEPLVNERYVPPPASAPRPQLTLGVTPLQGLRIGLYFTRGPYLAEDLQPLLPPGAGWRDFGQQVAGLDLHFARGYFELNGDFNRSDYEVPTHDDSFRGEAFFVEPRFTFGPRFFAALRLEGNDYVFIRPSEEAWLARTVKFHDVEIGLGYRAGPRTILKLAYREDRWDVDEDLRAVLPDGHSLAIQLSQGFDVVSWLERARMR